MLSKGEERRGEERRREEVVGFSILMCLFKCVL